MTARRFALAMAIAAAALVGTAPAALANPPVASFTVSQNGQTVTFDASASTADHPQRRSYRWFIDQPFESTNHLPVSSNPVLTQTFSPGTHTIDLVVSDEMCLEPPAGNNCVSSKVRKTFTVAAGSGPPLVVRQDGNARDNLQAGTAAANLQIGGGGSDRQSGKAGNDVQLPDAKAAQLCGARSLLATEVRSILINLTRGNLTTNTRRFLLRDHSAGPGHRHRPARPDRELRWRQVGDSRRDRSNSAHRRCRRDQDRRPRVRRVRQRRAERRPG